MATIADETAKCSRPSAKLLVSRKDYAKAFASLEASGGKLSPQEKKWLSDIDAQA
ncbi:hypothetical protein RZS28_17345 [Methylocapsa polymorpha]|uniref:Uncharacterized protein n=1 Tax=Methylocapsa polymorpha TaxID=3080828 RepID=A0ABZ0HQG7_9HYPH|nr:hypothetical protein RZS28_17345 [Methylocapsa sp. RX1]